MQLKIGQYVTETGLKVDIKKYDGLFWHGNVSVKKNENVPLEFRNNYSKYETEGFPGLWKNDGKFVGQSGFHFLHIVGEYKGEIFSK